MNIHKIIAVALAAVFTATAASSDLAADNLKKNNGPKTKIQLQKENKQLRSELDSLRLELERYRMEAEYADSIANEMMDLYTENEDKSAAGINPEDYTAEISDSLLNIWYVHKRISADDLEV